MITIKDLHFSYRRRPVFSGLNLQLEPGSIYGLLGRNGTGKSTLLRSISGFLFPQQGHIDAFGFQPGKRQPAFLEKVFLVPEEFQLPPVSIQQWLNNTTPFYNGFNIRAFERYIRDFDVPPTAKLTDMSYGQQKKALISFALATNASLLLMDEPTNGLDIVSKSQFRKVIAGAIDDNKCILISTHQVKDLEQLIDRVIILDEGKILFNESVATISERLLFKFSFDPEEAEQAIYSEYSFKGNTLILPNTAQEESRPDLETLYKAITLDAYSINVLFRK